jgi:hypothetical protein
MSDVQQLLRAYDRVLRRADSEGAIAWVRSRPPLEQEPLQRYKCLPRPTFLLRFFVLWHVDRATQELHRRLSRHGAIGELSPEEAADKDAVQVFRESLPPVRFRTTVALLLVAAIVFGQVAMQHAGSVLSAIPILQDVEEVRTFEVGEDPSDEDQPAVPLRKEATRLIERIANSISTDVAGIGKALGALGDSRLIDIGLVLAGLRFAVYVVSRPFLPAFRLKRLLFNLGDDIDVWRSKTTARWHVPRRTGVYRREDAVFAALGARPPSEPPIDLIIPALLCLSLPLTLGAYVISRAPTVVHGWYPPWIGWNYAIEIGGVLLAMALSRLAWLWLIFKRRTEKLAFTPPQVLELERARYVSVRDPLLVGFFAFFVPYYVMVWWYLVNRDLRRLGKHRSTSGLGRWPILSLFAFSPTGRALTLPVLVSAVRGARRLDRAEQAVTPSRRPKWGGRWTIVALLAAGLLLIELPITGTVALLSPLNDFLYLLAWRTDLPFEPLPSLALILISSAAVVGYFQHRLNSVWRHVGHPIPEGPEQSQVAVPAAKDEPPRERLAGAV